MTRRECPSGHPVASEASFCGVCGAQIPIGQGEVLTAKKFTARTVGVIVGAAAAIAVIAGLVGFALAGGSKGDQQTNGQPKPTATDTRPAATSTTSTTLPATTTTAARTTTTADSSPFSAAELAPLLPSASDAGSGYVIKPPEVDEQQAAVDEVTFERAVKAACPDTTGFFDSPEDDEVEMSFTTADGRTMTASLDPTPEERPARDQLIAATDDCGVIEWDQSGYHVTMELNAEPAGETGVQVNMVQVLAAPTATITASGQVLNLVVNGVGISTSAFSGYDRTRGETVDGDFDSLHRITTSLEQRVSDLHH